MKESGSGSGSDNRVGKILDERGQVYGPFKNIAIVSQALKQIMYSTPQWGHLTSDQAESLEMIMHKAARILCGSPNHVDSWDDISGYAQLVSRRLMQAPDTIEPANL